MRRIEGSPPNSTVILSVSEGSPSILHGVRRRGFFAFAQNDSIKFQFIEQLFRSVRRGGAATRPDFRHCRRRGGAPSPPGDLLYKSQSCKRLYRTILYKNLEIRTFLHGRGSDRSAAGGGYSDLSEWQRSVIDAGLAPRRAPGTATGSRAPPLQRVREFREGHSPSPTTASFKLLYKLEFSAVLSMGGRGGHWPSVLQFVIVQADERCSPLRQ